MNYGIVWLFMRLQMLVEGKWVKHLVQTFFDYSYHRLAPGKQRAYCRTSKSFVKKKAALTLLRLYRKHPAILQPEWADRILSLLDDADMGVTLSVTHLILALLQDYPNEYSGCYPKAVRRLKQV